jgi:hypothetical protein
LKEDQASSLRDLVEHIRLDSEDVRLANKLFQLISEARKEIKKKYKLRGEIKDMTWDQKIDELSSEAWMMEQVLSMLERFVERQTGRSVKGKKTVKTPGRHGGKARVYEES